MIVVSLDVLSRFFLNSPILGAMEFSLLLMISIVYFGLGYTEYTNRHISINIIYNKLHTNQQFFIRNLNYIILIIISSILFWHSFSDFLKSYEMNDILPGMAGFPKYPSKLCLSLGILIYIFVILFKLFSNQKIDK